MDNRKVTQLEEIARDACAQNNVALYGMELKQASKGLVLVVFITKISGVSVEECKKVSRYIERVLEEDDIISSRYYLEVSSPGLERDLKFKKHYVSAIGEMVKIVYSEGDDSLVLKGILQEVLPDEIVIEKDDENFYIHFSDIKKARTYFDYKKDVGEK